MKNSMRAVCEQHMESDQTRLPYVHVAISAGADDICIKISDRGGGIARNGLDRLWTYSYTTAKPQMTPSNIDSGDGKMKQEQAVMAGFGHGLPLSRLYAKYWGGDVQNVSKSNHITLTLTLTITLTRSIWEATYRLSLCRILVRMRLCISIDWGMRLRNYRSDPGSECTRLRLLGPASNLSCTIKF